MARCMVVICIDGLDPEYLKVCDAPVLQELARQGFMIEGQAVMPTVTNVNNVSIITGTYPEQHGITSNYHWDPGSGQGTYMESGSFVLAETMFQRATRLGATSALVTAKGKLASLLGDGAAWTVSAEGAPPWLTDIIGPPPPVYSLEVNAWVIDAALCLLGSHHPDLMYIATTDYAMHSYRPNEPQSQQHIALLDRAIGRLVESHPQVQLLITADHGMSSKTSMVDLANELATNGIDASAVPVIKDRYTVHHSNLGGSIYVYVDRQQQVDQALEVLQGTPGVDEALGREEAAARFHLHRDRIGDIFVLASSDVVFGGAKTIDMPEGLRSHGSCHEREVPIIGWGGDFGGFTFQENCDVGRYVMERVLPCA